MKKLALQRVLFFAALAVVLLSAAMFLVPGCGGGGGNNAARQAQVSGSSSGGDTGGTVTEEQKQATMDDIIASFDTLSHESNESDNEAILQYLQSRTEFVEVGLYADTGSLWAIWNDGETLGIFNDGETLGIFNDRYVSQSASVSFVDKANPTSSTTSKVPDLKDSSVLNTAKGISPMPYSIDAVLFNCFRAISQSDDYSNTSSVLGNIQLMLSEKGYNVKVLDGTLKNLSTQVKNCGVLVVNSHGGVIERQYTTPEGTYVCKRGSLCSCQLEL